jgi:hypothetical protein
VSKKTEPKIFCKYDELKDPNDLKNHPKNRNKHGQDQIDRLAKLYEFHGIRHPIIVSKRSGFIVAGHGRKLAAIRAGIKEMPVVYQDFDSDDREYAFLISDNAIALWAELDLSEINQDIPDLGPDFQIDMLGLHSFKIDPSELPDLVDSERGALRQMAFQLTEEQVDLVNAAIKKAKGMGEFDDTGSSNSNGNALARMAENFLGENGTG